MCKDKQSNISSDLLQKKIEKVFKECGVDIITLDYKLRKLLKEQIQLKLSSFYGEKLTPTLRDKVVIACKEITIDFAKQLTIVNLRVNKPIKKTQ